MTGTGSQTSVHQPRAGGSPRTLVIGAAAIIGGFAAYVYTMRWMRRDLGTDPLRTPTWQQRMAQQAHQGTSEGAGLSNAAPGTEPRTLPASIPLPDNDDYAGSNTGRGLNPDRSVPENPQNLQVSVTQRKNERGTTYTKGSAYAEGNLNKPEGYTKTPQDLEKHK